MKLICCLVNRLVNLNNIKKMSGFRRQVKINISLRQFRTIKEYIFILINWSYGVSKTKSKVSTYKKLWF
ncbi:hypothetical protein BpHYR1_026889 [Brachionus plicatilis]|uniref:Uncharacterized protein n=1 Tax=Brachionus plicatilis TaxID=10195 RepID=A0A3M7T8H5_BRAPC|nr:hypothetical protein BpHYR1_026889 [Brachionus plicatilis]